MTIRYVVAGENTLGYIDDRVPGMLAVLAGDVFRGGPDPKNGPISTFGLSIRPALPEDFDRFGVLAPPEMRVVPLDLGGAVIGLVEQPDGSIKVVP